MAIDPNQLLDTACTTAGHDDFGADGFREGLDVLLADLRHAQLNEIGWAAMETQIGGHLVNRLRIVAWAEAHPELRDAPVRRPLVVLGLPRTGTTFLSYLLACDPAHRSLLHWESMDSVPPPRAGELSTDPRVENARASGEMMSALNPEFDAMHYEAPDGPTECVTVLAADFRSLLWETEVNVPGYSEWLLQQDQTSAYEYHRLVLQVLQSEAPGRWSLKSPHHCIALPELLAQYPDARLVVTHRDPVTVTASTCSLVRSLSGTFSDGEHGAYIAQHWPDVLHELVTRMMDYRDAHPDQAFHDIDYDDLVRDPIATVRGIYERFGDELTAETEARMRDYVRANPQGKHGPHRYAPESVGLDPGALREQFAAYRHRFELA